MQTVCPVVELNVAVGMECAECQQNPGGETEKATPATVSFTDSAPSSINSLFKRLSSPFGHVAKNLSIEGSSITRQNNNKKNQIRG